MNKKSSSISNIKRPWIFKWEDAPTELNVIPRSKTKRLSAQSRLANIDAEESLQRAYNQEMLRVKVISEAMFKVGKASRYSLESSGREIFLRFSFMTRKIKAFFSK